MTCLLCRHGETKMGVATVTLQRGESVIIIRGVPADICENCSEYYLSEDVAGKVYSRAEEAIKKGVEIEIMKFVA